MPSARVSNAVKYVASISKCWHFLMYTMFLLSYVKWTFHAVQVVHIQRRMVLVAMFSYLFCFVVAVYELMPDFEAIL